MADTDTERNNKDDIIPSLNHKKQEFGGKDGSFPQPDFRASGKETVDGSIDELLEKQRKGDFVELINQCRIFDGKWVRDESYPLYPPGSCPYIGESFNCFVNGRPDRGYEKYRWQPNGCILPRLNGKHMLELLRGKCVVFVGDSLGQNMWESLVCVLRNSVEDKSSVFEVSGGEELGKAGSHSIAFRVWVEGGILVGNVTVKLNLSQMRDAHPPIYRKQNLTVEEKNSPTKIQDCSHGAFPVFLILGMS
ncbi:Translation elongation factor EF1B/ribosomal protein S6 family protein isoform 1 [Hibiscus syriacus]|uniref:Translation elongation factor EF1B/ribosomal protein S6 family protein isoform 1 n=1 Tax=Hibiscus syriacus TaxID=106335 RepID=A0A6A2XLD2_HIBSY|nr:Translation elongation factor EF1B/ribosomal protein S6 family protein isoform 1 [Hibiscus syriacus]